MKDYGQLKVITTVIQGMYVPTKLTNILQCTAEF